MERKIEVTPEMMEAGAAILIDRYECVIPLTAPLVARQVFERMLSILDGAGDEPPT